VRVQDQARRQPDAVPAAARPEIFRSEWADRSRPPNSARESEALFSYPIRGG
jgi:hypothetical protein